MFFQFLRAHVNFIYVFGKGVAQHSHRHSFVGIQKLSDVCRFESFLNFRVNVFEIGVFVL